MAHLPELVTLGLLGTPPWPVVGLLPLAESPVTVYRSWHAKPLLPSEEQMARGIRLPETKHYLVEERRDPVTGYWHTTETPATPEALRGLTRHASYLLAFVEEKLRLHHGLTARGSAGHPSRWCSKNCGNPD